MKWLNTKNAKPGVWQTRQASAQQWDEREGRECNGMWQQSGSYFNWKEARRGHTLGAAIKVSLAKHLSRKKLKRKSEMEKLNSRWQSWEKKYLNVTRSKQQAAAKHQWREHFEQLNRPEKHEAGTGGRQGVNLPLLLFRLFCCLLLFPHINRDVVGVCASCKSSYAKKEEENRKKEPKVEAQRGKWQMACFVLPFDSPRLDFFLPSCRVCKSRKAKALLLHARARLSCHFTALHTLQLRAH